MSNRMTTADVRRRLAWQDRAACATADPELFTATTLRTAAPALAICKGCPVQRDCWWLRGGASGRLPGVWAGRVYGDGGAELKPPPRVLRPLAGASVGWCAGCGRDVSVRGRDDCPVEGSLCRQVARDYHAARWADRRARRSRLRHEIASRGRTA